MNKNGIALIMAVGVLALLAIIATSFALNMRLEYHAAMNYYSGVKARYFAEAALQRAIAELRTHVKTSAFDDITEAWSLAGYSNNSMLIADKSAGRINSSGTSATTHIYDEQRKININTASADLLGNLVSRVFPSWSNGAVNTFVTNVTGHVPCNNLNELVTNVPSSSNNHIEKTDLDTLRPFITVNSYRDPNCGNRAPININTCSQAALESIFDGLKGATGPAINTAKAASVATAVDTARRTTPIKSWSGFDSIINNVSAITTAQQTAVKDNCNPNRTKPSPSTTEFCFNSGGYYTVTATGSVTGALGAAVASNTLSAVVKVYDIIYISSMEDFRGEDANYNNVLDAGEDVNGNSVLDTPIYARVTWLDSCPTESTDLFGKYSIIPTAKTIQGSLKLGYWDDFMVATKLYTRQQIVAANGDYDFENFDTSDSDHELCRKWGAGGEGYGKYCLSDTNKWTWGDFSLRVHEKDAGAEDPSTKCQAYILFRGVNVGSPVLLLANGGDLSWDSGGGKVYAWWVNTIDPTDPTGTTRISGVYDMTIDVAGQNVRKILYATVARAATPLFGDPWFPAPLIKKAIYTPTGSSPHLRLWPNSNALYAENWNTTNPQPTEYYAAHSLSGTGTDDSKTFNLRVQGRTVTANVYVSGSDTGLATPLTNSAATGNVTNLTGLIGLYGHGMYPAWDDLRIISSDGNYISQTISPDSGNMVGWGTITGTVTIPSTADANSEKVTFQTKSNTDGVTWKDANPAADGAIGSIAGNNIQYKALLTTADPDMKKTPVLEDITITYLPKVSIKSFLLSN